MDIFIVQLNKKFMQIILFLIPLFIISMPIMNLFNSMAPGFVSYKFQILSSPETSQTLLKVGISNLSASLMSSSILFFIRSSADDLTVFLFQICVDVDHAKCSICLNIWHDVVTVAPCLHNFWYI
jgi:hypothetical protein